MKNILKKVFVCFIVASLCFVISACNLNPKTDDNAVNDDVDPDLVLYTDIGDRFYYKENIYRTKITMDNEVFHFPILANKTVYNISDVMFFDGEEPVDCNITVFAYTNVIRSSEIKKDLYITMVSFKIFIRNISGVKVNKIRLVADGVQAEYSVDITFNYYYVDPGYYFYNMDYAYSKEHDNEYIYVEYLYNMTNFSFISRFNHAESLLDGLKIEQVQIAENPRSVYSPQPPFIEVGNDDTNTLEYQSFYIKIKYDYTDIKKEALFFNGAIKVNVTIHGKFVDVVLYGGLTSLYYDSCKDLQI